MEMQGGGENFLKKASLLPPCTPHLFQKLSEKSTNTRLTSKTF
jgi:hypothetical protein